MPTNSAGDGVDLTLQALKSIPINGIGDLQDSIGITFCCILQLAHDNEIAGPLFGDQFGEAWIEVLERYVDESKELTDKCDAADRSPIRHERCQRIEFEGASAAGALRTSIGVDEFARLCVWNSGSSDRQDAQFGAVDERCVESLFGQLSEAMKTDFLEVWKALK